MARVADRFALVAGLLVAACGSDKPPADSGDAPQTEPAAAPPVEPVEPVEPAAAPPKPADVESPLALPTVDAAGPMTFDPPIAGDGKLPHDPRGAIDPEVGTMAYHLDTFGWSADSRTFMACGDSGADVDGPCVFVDLGGESETLMGDDPRFAERMAAGPFAVGSTQWRYGGEITFTWSAKEMSVELGGRLGSGRGKHDILSWRFDEQEFAGGEAYPEVVSLSPDGEQLAVVGHASLGEVADEWTPKLIDVDQFAAEVYAQVAFDHLKASEYAEAETWFAKAAAVDDHWKHPYNLACVRARAGAEGVEPALRQAIERGGESVRRKARTDADLDAVRREAWFVELLGG